MLVRPVESPVLDEGLLHGFESGRVLAAGDVEQRPRPPRGREPPGPIEPARVLLQFGRQLAIRSE